ncbi:3693_t:CDS:1, partial [Cetraspora pellucida]
NIDTIFDIDKDERFNMNISDQELDYTLNIIMNITDNVKEV